MSPLQILSAVMTMCLLVSSLPTLAAPPEPRAVDPTPRPTIRLDDFEHLSGWSTATSSDARLELAQDTGRAGGRAMRLDFEFQAGTGWVIARKVFPRRLPDNFAFHYFMRGDAPPGGAEFKLVDPRHNVWWFKQRNYAFPSDWRPITVKKRHLSVAWGPGGSLEEMTAIEFALVSGGKGKGSVWIDDLNFEERESAQSYTQNPVISASTDRKSVV